MSEADARLRVLRILTRANVGGPARQIRALEQGIDRTRFDTRVLVGQVGPDEADLFAAEPLDRPVRVIPGLGRAPKPLDDLRALRALRAEIRAYRPHIVHTHMSKAGFLGRLAAWSCRVPATVHTFHGHLLHGYFRAAVTRAIVTTERLLARRTTRLVAVGNRVRDDLLAERVGKPEQYVVVPPGTALARLPDRRAARADLGIADEAVVVAFVGRLTPIKRVDRLAAVARAVVEARPATVFVVAGDGSEADALRDATAPIRDRVLLLGSRTDVEPVYAASDLVVLTSDNEGTPVTLIEAGLAGLPAVTTAVGSAPDVVLDGESGFVCSTDADELAAAVLKLADDPDLRARFGARAKAHTTEAYSAARLIRDTEALYASLAPAR